VVKNGNAKDDKEMYSELNRKSMKSAILSLVKCKALHCFPFQVILHKKCLFQKKE
jgi:hypothetical protein